MNLLLIITGSIAAKKCKKIVSELSKKKIIIDIIVTNSAKKIIDINPLKKIIKGKIYLDSSEKRKKMLHIRLARKASLIVVCPATANIIAKYSNGYADDLASTTLIASDKQIVFVPAMNVEMWNNNINLRNVKKVLEVSPKSFYPVPKVKSTVLLMEPKKDFFPIKNPKNLEHITNVFFNQRRKMIKHPLKILFKNTDKISKKLNININDRPQNLSPLKYFELCKEYENLTF